MAVEIKKTRSGSFLNKPVGVTRVTTGAEKVYAQQAEILSGVGEFAFELAKEDQITRGKEYANTARVRDENGKLDYKALPFDLGRYGQAAANEILSNRYMIALKDDMVTAAKEISKISDGNPTKFEEGFSAWTKQRAKLMEGSGGTDIIAPFIDSAYTYQKEFVNDLVIKRVEVENAITKSQYGRTSRDQANSIQSSFAAGEFDDATQQLKASELEANNLQVSGAINFDTSNKAKRMYSRSAIDGLVDFHFKGRGSPALRALEVELRGGESGINILKQTPGIKAAFDRLDDADRSTFLGDLSKRASAEEGFQKKFFGNQVFKRDYELGVANKTSEAQRSLNAEFGYTSFLDVTGLSVGTLDRHSAQALLDSHEKENNAQFPSEMTQDLAGSFASGGITDDIVIATLDRFENIRAAQDLKGRNLLTYLGGGDSAKKFSNMATALNVIREVSGDESVVPAYRQIILNQSNDSEALKTVRNNFDFEYDKEQTDRTNIRNAAKALTRKLDIPSHLKDRVSGAVEFFLTVPDLNVKRAVEDYASLNYPSGTRFYEDVDGYSIYPNPPEMFLDEGSLDVLSAFVENKAMGRKVFLKQQLDAGDSVTWAAYTRNAMGQEEPVYYGEDLLLIDSKKFQALNKTKALLSRAELMAMRNSSLEQYTESSAEKLNKQIMPFMD